MMLAYTSENWRCVRRNGVVFPRWQGSALVLGRRLFSGRSDGSIDVRIGSEREQTTRLKLEIFLLMVGEDFGERERRIAPCWSICT